MIRSAIGALRLPPGSRGLDAGCGTGSHTPLLTEAVGPAGQVTGLDLSRELLEHAQTRLDAPRLKAGASFLQGDAGRLPFKRGSFDWVWSVDCVAYASPAPVSALRELARVVKPGGTIAVLAWSSQQLLPGYPLLEARLNATRQGIAPFSMGSRPESHFLRALGWLREAGLEQTEGRTFVGDIRSPLTEETRAALLSLFGMRWGEPRQELSPEDWAQFQRLCQPESPDFILDLPDYYAFFTYSMFRGTVAG